MPALSQSPTARLLEAASCLPLDAKRRPARRGLESWYPYYAGYSEAFASTVLESVGLRPGATVLDPWNGSGTTTLIADRMGFRGIGFDLNPVAALISNAKLARPRDAENVLGFAKRVTTRIPKQGSPTTRSDPLSSWLQPSITAYYRHIERAILASFATGRSQVPLEPCAGGLPPLAAFQLLALMRAARSLAGVRQTTNPTWILPGDGKRVSREALGRMWVQLLESMATDLAATTSDARTGTHTVVGDARALPLPNEAADFVLTSPPYCTRIDYPVSSAFELAALGLRNDSESFGDLRRSFMGTPLARKGKPERAPTHWPSAVRRLLARIQAHPSKASRSYYYKTYLQYFQDAELALSELHRVLRPGGAVVLVVQSSFYKDIFVDLAALYEELGSMLGFQSTLINSISVRRALSQINSRSLRHRTESTCHESVVALERVA